MQPPPFPRSEADLAEWLVYTDWLLTRGDRRGELMALDLALPAAPAREPLQQFHDAARRLCRPGRAMRVSWCLGHARAIDIPAAPIMVMHRALTPPSSSVLANASEFLRTPVAASLERLSTAYVPGEPKPWRRLFAALPARCARVALALRHDMLRLHVDELLDMLPPTVREIEVGASPRAGLCPGIISDRFELVDFGSAPVGPQAFDRYLGERLAATRSVKLRLRQVALFAPPWERCVLGDPDDAALLVPRAYSIAMIPRLRLDRLQARFGVIPARAQIAAALPERHTCGLNIFFLLESSDHGATLVRRGDAWTLRSYDSLRATHNGERIEPRQVVSLQHGDRFTVDNMEYLFVTRDAARYARSALG